LGVPVTGITLIKAASARQFFLRNSELVRLPGLNDEFASVLFPYAARNGAAKVTVTKPVSDDFSEALKGLTKLGAAILAGG
jgi:hypothetical protein